MIDEKKKMYAWDELNGTNASKLLSKIKSPSSIVEMWFKVRNYENVDEKIGKIKKINEK